MKALNHKQIVNLIASVGDKRTVLVEGENGIGKTALFHMLKRMPQFKDHIAVDPIDCTQLSDGSVWMPDIDREMGVSRELPNERFGVGKDNQRGVKGSKPVLMFFDEIAKAPQFIKNVIAPVVYERRVGNYHLVEGSIVVGATNMTVEGLGDSIQPHLRTRLIKVRLAKPTADEWILWAQDNDISPSVIAFVKMHPWMMDSFLDYQAGGKFAGKNLAKDNPSIFNPAVVQDGYFNPRSAHAASDIVKRSSGLDDEALNAALCGTIGETAAEALAAFVRFERAMPVFERVVADPLNTPIDDNPSAQLVQIFNFINRVSTREEAAAVTHYVRRMRKEMQTLMGNTVANSNSIAKFATCTEFSELLRENHIFL